MIPIESAVKAPTLVTAIRLGVRSMWRHPLLAGLFLAATVAQGALQGLIIWALRAVLISFSGAHGMASTSLFGPAMGILGILVLQSTCVYVAEVLSAKLGYSVEVESMLEVLTKLLRLEMRFFDRHSQGDVVMSSYYDLKGIRSVTMEIGKAILYISRLAGLGVVAWLMSPKLAAAAVSLSIVVGIAQKVGR